MFLALLGLDLNPFDLKVVLKIHGDLQGGITVCPPLARVL
jgi:hypothetical protein